MGHSKPAITNSAAAAAAAAEAGTMHAKPQVHPSLSDPFQAPNYSILIIFWTRLYMYIRKAANILFRNLEKARGLAELNCGVGPILRGFGFSTARNGLSHSRPQKIALCVSFGDTLLLFGPLK